MARRVKPRRYVSALRSLQAADTRRRVLRQARRMFTDRGYAGTSMAAIARETGVAERTVYLAFASKRHLLLSLIDTEVTGGDDRAAARNAIAAIFEGATASEALTRLASVIRTILGRTSALFATLREAASADPEIAKLAREYTQRREEDVRSVVAALADRSDLAVSKDEAADLLWVFTSPDLYSLMISRGWTPDRYEMWLAVTLIRVLLVPTPSGSSRRARTR